MAQRGTAVVRSGARAVLLSPEQRQAQETLAKIRHDNPALADKIDEILAIDSESIVNLLEQRLRMGQMLLEIRDDPERRFGDGAVDKAIEALGPSRGRGRWAMRVVEGFGDTELLASFLTRRSPTGMAISISHLEVIVTLPTDELRRNLIEKVYARSLSHAETAEEVKHYAQTAGSLRVRPATLVGGFTHFKSMARTFAEKLEEEFSGTLLDKLSSLSEPNEPTLQALNDIEAELAKLAKVLELRVAEIEKLKRQKGWGEEERSLTRPARAARQRPAPAQAQRRFQATANRRSRRPAPS